MNLRNGQGLNALEYKIGSSVHEYADQDNAEVNRTIIMLLFAAGEAVGGATVDRTDWLQSALEEDPVPVPEYIQELKEPILCLKHICREVIRKHLMDLDPEENLFIRIPQLNLPNVVSEYLLYDMSLDDDGDDVGNDSDRDED